MSEPKFTPGPWQEVTGYRAVEICTIHCCSPRSTEQPEAQRWVYIVADGSTHRSEAEQDANASLIAAAPDMYEALRLMLCHGEMSNWFATHGDTEVVEQARAALAKARGEP